MIDSDTRNEIVATVVRLREALDDLTVRGLKTAGGADLKLLDAAHIEFERIGAAHLAGRLGDLVEKTRQGGGQAGRCLLQAQTSLRLFERLLTRETALDQLESALAAVAEAEGEP